MRILIVVPNFIPEIGSAAHIYYDLARGFHRRGHDVDVITSFPRTYYLAGGNTDSTFPLDETIDGINVHRCKYPILRDNLLLRGFEHFILSHYYFKTYKKLGKNFDICLIYIPPLPLYYFAKKVKKHDGTPSILNYQDFHPKELVDVGVLKNRIIISLMEYIERQSYRNSDFITVLTEGGINFVSNRGGNPIKVAHIFNSVNLDEINCAKEICTFKREEGIEDKFLISYAGIISYFQNIDFVLNAAKQLLDQKDVIFYIVGDGNYREQLIKRVQDEKISNVKILPLQPREKYYNIINSSDISLISLDSRMKTPCLPGKTINLLAFEQPILAIVPSGSETAKVIEKSQSGLIVEHENIIQLTQAILELKNDPEKRKKFGENGRRYVEKNMNLEKNLISYEGFFIKLIDLQKNKPK